MKSKPKQARKKPSFPETILARCAKGTKKKLDAIAKKHSALGDGSVKWSRSDVGRQAIITYMIAHQ